MKISNFFALSLKSDRSIKCYDLSEKYLINGYFIQKYEDGRYYFLPLGVRVINNILNLLRKYLEREGACETLIPLFHSMELRKESEREIYNNEFIKDIKDRDNNIYNLGASPEEMYLNLLRKYLINEKDLPITLFQFGKKFRDEDHTRFLLRLKEFTMMDAYSFHSNKNDFEKVYKKMCNLFSDFLYEVGLSTKIVNSFNGLSIRAFAHEFISDSEVGESGYLLTDDNKYITHTDIAAFQKNDINPQEIPLPNKTVEVPMHIKSIWEYSTYFSVPLYKIIKCKAYKNLSTNQIYITIIRGDLDFNENKIKIAIGNDCQIIEANDVDLLSIGLKQDTLPTWECKDVICIGDDSLLTVRNFIGGRRINNTDVININYGRDFKCDILTDISKAKQGYISPTGKKLYLKNGIELGNTYQFGYFITSKMKQTTFVDKNKKNKPLYMGAYSIGVERLMAAVVEKNHDNSGIIWPISIAPYKIYLIGNTKSNTNIKCLTEKIYLNLEKHFDILYDDRNNVSFKEKIKNSLLIGLPFIIIVDNETLISGKYKLINRKSLKEARLSLNEIVNLISKKNGGKD